MTTSVYKVYIVSDSELRIEDNNPTKTFRQKLITHDEGPLDTVFTYDELLEIAAIILNCKYLRVRYERELDLIAWCSASQQVPPPRNVIVDALKLLLTRWSAECTSAEGCIPPTSIDKLNDTTIRKILIAYHHLKNTKKS